MVEPPKRAPARAPPAERPPLPPVRAAQLSSVAMNAAAAASVIAILRALISLLTALLLTKIPIYARHDGQGLARYGREQMFVRRVLRARGVRVWNHTVGSPRMSANTSFGSEPPRFGRIAGFLPVVRSIDAAVHLTHGDSGS